MSGVDVVTERASRWLAARTSRRTFLSTSAKVAIVGAGGLALSQVFSSRADARVCGQSGTSPKCPTYDCVGPDVAWGWCWYASPGCCANGGLKKICDCCGRGYPNVHGYCPEGSNVYCVVESCLEDPRVQKVTLERFVGASAVEISLARLAQRPAGSAANVVVANGLDVLTAAVAAPIAAEFGAPLVLVEPDMLRSAVAAELRRVGTTSIAVVGALDSGVASALGEIGRVQFITTSPDVAVASAEAASWLIGRTTRTEVVVVGAGGPAVAVAPAAAAYAAARRRPLVIGTDALGAVRANTRTEGPVTLIGDEVVARAGSISFSTSVPGADAVAISVYLADQVLAAAGGAGVTIGFAPVATSALAAGLLPFGGPLVLHADDRVTPELREWLISRRARFSAADVVRSGNGALSDQGIYELQSALNGFDAHLLIGVDGMGLPVIAQPIEERALGQVRVSGDLPAATTTLITRAAQRSRSGTATTAPVRIAPPVTPPPRTAPSPAVTVPPASAVTVPSAPPSATSPATAAPATSRDRGRR